MRFNPRARDGREDQSPHICNVDDVSIHAPVMDAKLWSRSVQQVISFNPRARDGREYRD